MIVKRRVNRKDKEIKIQISNNMQYRPFIKAWYIPVLMTAMYFHMIISVTRLDKMQRQQKYDCHFCYGDILFVYSGN